MNNLISYLLHAVLFHGIKKTVEDQDDSLSTLIEIVHFADGAKDLGGQILGEGPRLNPDNQNLQEASQIVKKVFDFFAWVGWIITNDLGFD